MHYVQKPLPKLPIPELTKTLNKYLLCIRPIVSNDQYERTRQLVEEFQTPGGSGELLQKRLLEYAETTDNWVSDIANSPLCFLLFRSSTVTMYTVKIGLV